PNCRAWRCSKAASREAACSGVAKKVALESFAAAREKGNPSGKEGYTMSFASDFKAFIMRGNVVDLAVAVVIGGAFGKIVSSLVADIIMPPIGLLIGGIDFSSLKWIVKDSPDPKQVVAINYGTFINTIITFLIIALAIFIVIKLL